MAITKQKKADILAGLGEAAKNATSMVFVGFTRLTVAEMTKLRRALREDGVSVKVAKKRLIGKALTDAGIPGAMPALPGEVAVAYSAGDSTAPARGIHAFVKEFKDKLVILGGVFDGSFADQGKMQEIATIPPVPVLRGMFVNVINSPIQGLVIALNAVAEKKQ